MLRYTIHRILQLIPVLICVVILVFTINYFSTGSPAFALITGSDVSTERVEEIEEGLGLNRPYFVQLGEYFWNLITKGSFGTSYVYRKPVWELIRDRIPVTIKIGLSSAVLSALIGIPLGILAAVKQNSIFDYSSTFLAVILAALPSFWVCLILMLFFCVKLSWFPVTGITSWKSYVLPIIAAAIGPVAMVMRMTRSSMLEVVHQDYIRTARAKGLSEKSVIWRHALKNALIPVITVVGMNIGIGMTGSVIVETIFNIPGLGLLMRSTILLNDFITTQGCVLICAFIIACMNLVTDLCYAAVDPRIKAQYSTSKKRRHRQEDGQTEEADKAS